MVDEVESVALA
jgi:hypothetical protein